MKTKTKQFGVFVIYLLLLSHNPVVATNSDSPAIEDEVIVNSEDSTIHSQFISWGQDKNLKEQPLSEIIVETGQYFIGSPYVAHTLEKGESEKLVVNLREFDCTTYVETVLALSFCVKSGQTDFSDYLENLRKLRYRDGEIEGYPSRLHYFSEWLRDNQEKNLVEIVSNHFGDGDFDADVGFMSAHPDKYDRLKGRADFIEEIREAEQRIVSYEMNYVSAEQMGQVSHQIKDGDIIAFCSSIEGLDITHVALAKHTPDGLYFMHASLSGERVMLSEVPLESYIRSRDQVYGVLVGRAVCP
jgi:hypothetical protein